MVETMTCRTLWTAGFAALAVVGTAIWPDRIVTPTGAAATLSGRPPDAVDHAPGARLLLGRPFSTRLPQQVLPKSLVGRACEYAFRRWKKLERYLDYGDVEIDNNPAERSIKPVAIGRKSWLHFGSNRRGCSVTRRRSDGPERIRRLSSDSRPMRRRFLT